MKKWFAVVTDNDGDWGTGSYNYDEAVALANHMAEGDDFDQVELVEIEIGNDPIAVNSETIK